MLLLVVTAAHAGEFPAAPDTLRLVAPRASAPPVDSTAISVADRLDALVGGPAAVRLHPDDVWLRAPFGDGLLTPADEWLSRRRAAPRDYDHRLAFEASYDRVDQVKAGVRGEYQHPDRMWPRLAGRLAIATGRSVVLYGVQFEQPLQSTARLVAGLTAVRTTAHGDLQQVDDLENSLALLFGRQDYRDYFEREGVGAYLAWRVPEFSTVSLHLRGDRWHSLVVDRGTRSWFQRGRELRDNPPIDDGESRSILLRSERLAHATHRTRAGLYHWIEFERAGGSLGGDFTYSRALADVRSLLRLSPTATLNARGVLGLAPGGDLPAQRRFTIGGVDGLRAHAFASASGDQAVLGQAEFSTGLRPGGSTTLAGNLLALLFLDVGQAWTSGSGAFDLGRQHVAIDGGFGLATGDDDLRVYLARDLQRGGAFVVSLRLQRPF